MNDQIQTLPRGAGYGGVATNEQRQKVLRNTYWLLALSMIPTVLGAWLGVATGITAGLGGGLGLVVFLGGAFAFMFAIEKTKNSAAGVPVLLAFTFFMGIMLARLIGVVLGLANGMSLKEVAQAYGTSTNTVRVQLQAVFRKTGVNRQVDLVRLFLAGPFQLAK